MVQDRDRQNLPPLSLHVPEPHSRPGDEVDFTDLAVPPAGEMRRPDETSLPAEITDLAYGLVRVLDEEHRAVGPWDPRLDGATLLKILRAMALTRAFDERMFRAQRQGKTSFYMKCTGEEAVAVAAAFALHRDDMCFPSYRQQGILFARDYPLVSMINQIFSNRLDPLFGIGIALYILYTAWQIARGALDMLMDRELPDEDRKRIRAIAMAHPEVRSLHDLRTRGAGPTISAQLRWLPSFPSAASSRRV